jgi:hypothetical protein
MCFESFRVELRGGTATADQVREVVNHLLHAKPDPTSIATSGSTYYTVEDGRHFVEVEVATFPVKVSCRFTLCHPPSIDAAFLGFVRQLMVRLGMEAVICDRVPPPHSEGFPAARFSEFADIVSRCISARRAEWVANFGTAQLAASTPEVYEKIILPKCVPVAG